MNKLIIGFCIFLFPALSFAVDVAITVDDLPAHMNLPSDKTRLDVANQMLTALNKHHIKNIYGFINAGNIKNKDDYNVLTTWVDSGQMLGNHTYDHVDFDSESTEKFIEQIKMNDPILLKIMGNKNYRYFRYPYLHEGNTEFKRNAARKYLFSNQYKIAQVTMDFEDYLWNDPYARCVKMGDKKSIAWLKKSYIQHALNSLIVSNELSALLFHRNIKHILLMHIGAFDAFMMDDLLTAFKNHGVNIISLDEALSDEVYNINPNIAEDNSDTFLKQMLVAKHLPIPDKVKTLLASIPEEKLDKLCR